MDNLLLQGEAKPIPKIGELVEGTIINVSKNEIQLNISGLTTGVVRGKEIYDESGEYSNIKVGDKVLATVLELENEQGQMELSFRYAGHQKAWQKLEDLERGGEIVEAKVIDANKGGLMMQVDAISGFMPVSQLNPDHYPRVPGGDKNRILEHLKSLIGQILQVKVIDAKEEDEKLIVSEKAVWEDEQKVVLDSFKVGDIVEGEVSALTSFGAFIKFDEGMEGLVHISEIVWQRIDHPKDILKVGDKVNAQIIDINKSKIYLSIRRLIDDPWKKAKDKYKAGTIVEGLVHKVEHFGLMIKLDEDIHGLAHLTELSDDNITLDEMREKFQIGSKHKFEIISIEPSEHRLGLKLEGVKGKPNKLAEPKEKVGEESVVGEERVKPVEVKTEESAEKI